MGVLDDFPDGLERVPQGGVTDGPLMVEDRPPFEPERQWYNVTNVKDFGAFGNGQDDSERIQEAIEATPDGGVIYFPREVPLGAYEFAVEVNGRHCLTFIGDGCSKLRWLGTAPIFKFAECTGITLTRLWFEGNGYLASPEDEAPLLGGLVVAEHSKRFRVTQTRWTDATPLPVAAGIGRADLLAPQRPGLRVVGLHVAGPDTASEDVWVHDNEMYRYGIAVHDARRVRITSNTIQEAAGHAIWVGSVMPGSVAEDVVITDNRIVDPLFYGVALMDRGVGAADAGALLLFESSIQRVRIARNQITKSEAAASRGRWNAIWVGAHPSVRDEDFRERGSNVYRDICVEDNVCSTTRPRGPDLDPDNGIRFDLEVQRRTREQQTLLRSDPCFERATVRGNDVRAFSGDGIYLSQLRYSVVGDNCIRECNRGLVLETNVGQNHVHRNRVIDIVREEYVLKDSLGWNVLNGNVRLNGDDGRASWLYEDPEEPITDHFFGSDVTSD